MDEDLAIGIEELDEQHRQFFRHAANLRKALIEGAGAREAVLKTLRFLEEFVEHHFRAEEGYMRRHNYPGILVHEREHVKFRETIAELKRNILDRDARGEYTPFLAVEMERKLEGWLKEHIMTTDKKFGVFLAGRM